MDIGKIQKSVKRKNYFTHHAVQKMINRNTTESELIEAISSGEIIKEFPRDKYGPSCLIFGYSKNSRPIHVLVTFSDPSWFINSYEPSIQEWVNFRKRKI